MGLVYGKTKLLPSWYHAVCPRTARRNCIP
ncbi:UNVERIFIED_CONTAM: hypothetical protein GTU68_016367 [Idotea baltica]|nr:hypothetical protein [Idotea baltica]